MKKRILGLFLLIAAAVMLPLAASAATVNSGTYGNVTWELDTDGTLTVRGTGDMGDMSGYGRVAPWESYKTDIKKVVLSEGVTRIGSSAFEGCANLTEVYLPDTLECLGYCAFKDCSKLSGITIPKSVTHIEGGVFSGTPAIAEKDGFQLVGDALVGYTGTDQEVVVPDGVRIVADDIFTDEAKENMTKIVFPDDVEYIGVTFIYCTNLTDITFPSNLKRIIRQLLSNAWVQNLSGAPWLTNQPDGVVYINDIAYYYNGENPEVIEIKEGTRAIGDYFTGSSKNGWKSETKKIILPDSLERIEDYAFKYCYLSEGINIPDNVKYIGEGAFSYSGLKSISIPNGVTKISNSMFSNCRVLTSVNIPNSVTSIGDSVFSDCAGLTSINIPNSVTSIGDDAFYGCAGLTNINIPNSVTSIGDYAFYDCNNLNDIYYFGTEQEWKRIEIDEHNENLLNATVHFMLKPLEIEKVEPVVNAETNTVAFPVTVVDESRAPELEQVEMYIAEYDEAGRFTGLKPCTKSAIEGDTVTITADIPETDNYKFMLWDGNNVPLMDAVTNIE